MRTALTSAFLFIGLFFSSAALANDYFIKNAHLFEDTSAKFPVNILIEGDKIVAIGPKVQSSPNATTIDADGKFVTPALMNSSTQLGLIEMHSIKETVDSGGSENDLGAAFDVQYGLNQNSSLLDVARSEGLARAVVLPSGSDETHFAGLGALIHLTDSLSILDKPKAALVAETGSTGSSAKSRSAIWVKIRQGLEEAKTDFDEFQAGEDDLDDDERIVHDVLTRSVPLVIRASRESDIAQAIALSKDFKIRVIIIGGEEAWRLAPELAAAKVPVIIIPYSNLPSAYDAIGSRVDNATILHDAGVLIGFSVDSIFVSHNAGNAMRVGAGIAAGNGLSKKAALDAMTINPAQIWGISDRYGTLEVGKTADIVIWSGDPLEALTWPHTVIINGKQFTGISRPQALSNKYFPDGNSFPDSSISTMRAEQEP